MAIFSLHHSAIGRTTHRAGTAGAHVAYVTRRRAASAVLTARMPVAAPGSPGPARDWLDAHEAASRKNARVADRIMIALPLELDANQRKVLVSDFAEALTGGRAPWLAAIHANGKDAANPHAHVMLVDRDPITGKRVVGMSEKGSTERARLLWEMHANAALAAVGVSTRIDRRSLAEQGIERIPEIHVGPTVQAMIAHGVEPVSRDRLDHHGREIRWTEIDKGRSRAERRREIIAADAKASAAAEAARWAALAETWELCAQQIEGDRAERGAAAAQIIGAELPSIPVVAFESCGTAGKVESDPALSKRRVEGPLTNKIREMNDGDARRLAHIIGAAGDAKRQADCDGEAHQQCRERICDDVGIAHRAASEELRAYSVYRERFWCLVTYVGDQIGRVFGYLNHNRDYKGDSVNLTRRSHEKLR